MPEGDTLARTAAGLRPYLLGRVVEAARVHGPGSSPRVERVVGARIAAVDSVGKNLLIRFDNGLEIRTHLRMNGSWHRYRPGERWRRPAARARLVLEVPGAVAVCFDAPVVELFEQRAEQLHPVLSALGPDILAPGFEPDGALEAIRRLRSNASGEAIAEAITDQRCLAGIGNMYKSEVLFAERVDPFASVSLLDDETLLRLVRSARRLMLANVPATSGPAQMTVAREMSGRRQALVYGRGGRPCRRCGTPIATRRHGDSPRVTYWCPSCQEARRARETADPSRDIAARRAAILGTRR
jgi:endonuclease VIII